MSFLHRSAPCSPNKPRRNPVLTSPDCAGAYPGYGFALLYPQDPTQLQGLRIVGRTCRRLVRHLGASGGQSCAMSTLQMHSGSPDEIREKFGRRRIPRIASGLQKRFFRESLLAFAQCFGAGFEDRFEHVVQHAFLAGDDVHGGDHAGDDQQRMLGAAQVAFVGA